MTYSLEASMKPKRWEVVSKFHPTITKAVIFHRAGDVMAAKYCSPIQTYKTQRGC